MHPVQRAAPTPAGAQIVGLQLMYLGAGANAAGHLLREDSFLYASDASKHRQAVADQRSATLTSSATAPGGNAAAGPPVFAGAVRRLNQTLPHRTHLVTQH